MFILLSYWLFLTISLSSCMISKCRYSNGFNIDFGVGKSEQVSMNKKLKKRDIEPKNIVLKDSALTFLNSDVFLMADSVKELDLVFSNHYTANSKTNVSETQYSEKFKGNFPKRSKLTNDFKTKTRKNFIKENKIGLLNVLIEVIKFIIFTALAISVFLFVLVGALFFASISTGILLAILILILSFIFVFILAVIYEWFGYGSMEDVFNFFGSLFWN